MTPQKRTAAEAKLSKWASDIRSANPQELRPALKPRPILFLILAIFFALWVVALIVMRWRTIIPAPIPAPTHPTVIGR
jgi:hypothetical protein